MIAVQFLEATDVFLPDDWCRPLDIVTMSGGHSEDYSFKSCYSGTPENNVKWTRVRDVIGGVWRGATVGAFNRRGFTKYEFVRGEIPRTHRLSMGDYRSLEDTWKTALVEDEDYDL